MHYPGTEAYARYGASGLLRRVGRGTSRQIGAIETKLRLAGNDGGGEFLSRRLNEKPDKKRQNEAGKYAEGPAHRAERVALMRRMMARRRFAVGFVVRAVMVIAMVADVRQGWFRRGHGRCRVGMGVVAMCVMVTDCSVTHGVMRVGEHERELDRESGNPEPCQATLLAQKLHRNTPHFGQGRHSIGRPAP